MTQLKAGFLFLLALTTLVAKADDRKVGEVVEIVHEQLLAAQVAPPPETVDRTAQVAAMVKDDASFPQLIDQAVQGLAQVQDAIDYIRRLNILGIDGSHMIPTLLGGGLEAIGLFGLAKTAYQFVTVWPAEKFKAGRAARVLAKGEHAIEKIVETGPELDEKGEEYMHAANELREQIRDYPNVKDAPYAQSIRGKSPKKIDQILQDPEKRKEIVKRPKFAKWVEEYETRRKVEKALSQDIQRISHKAFEPTLAFWESMDKAARGYRGFLRDPRLYVDKLNFEIRPSQTGVGNHDVVWNGTRERTVQDASQMQEGLSTAAIKCRDAMAKVRDVRDDHKHAKALSLYWHPLAYSASLAGGFFMYKWGTQGAKGTSPQALVHQKQVQDQVNQTSAGLSTQSSTTVAAALKAARKLDKDSDLLGVYAIFREKFRAGIHDITTDGLTIKGIKSSIVANTTEGARKEAKFLETLAILEHPTPENKGNEILDNFLDLSLAQAAFLVDKKVKVEEIKDLLFSDKRELNSKVLDLLKQTHSGVINEAWPLLKVSNVSIPVESETIAAIVNATLPPLTNLIELRKKRLEGDDTKATASDPKPVKTSANDVSPELKPYQIATKTFPQPSIESTAPSVVFGNAGSRPASPDQPRY